VELYEVREMMAKELRGILHEEFNAYLENYNGDEGDDRRGFYDIILFHQRDPRELLYIDIAKATAIMCLYETTKNSREYIEYSYLQLDDALENTLTIYDFSADFLEWLIKKYSVFGLSAEVLVIEKEIERRGLHIKNSSERFNL
jgi:hypothetical protein